MTTTTTSERTAKEAVRYRFSKNLRALRLLDGRTQEQLAFGIGVTRSRYSGWECADSEPGLLHLAAIQDHLQVGLDLLVGHDLHAMDKDSLRTLVKGTAMRPRPTKR